MKSKKTTTTPEKETTVKKAGSLVDKEKETTVKKASSLFDKEKETTARKATSLFDKENKLWMLAGIAVMIIGFLLMAGGRSQDPNVFNANEVYSTTRITIAPILILAGLVTLVFSIFREPKRR